MCKNSLLKNLRCNQTKPRFVQSRTVPVRLCCQRVQKFCVCVCGLWSRERDRWCPRKSLLHLPCITESYAPSSPLASYTSPYVREQQVGLSSVLSLPSLSPSTAPPYVCVERERLLVVHTHLSLSLHTHLAAPSLGDGSFS